MAEGVTTATPPPPTAPVVAVVAEVVSAAAGIPGPDTMMPVPGPDATPVGPVTTVGGAMSVSVSVSVLVLVIDGMSDQLMSMATGKVM